MIPSIALNRRLTSILVANILHSLPAVCCISLTWSHPLRVVCLSLSVCIELPMSLNWAFPVDTQIDVDATSFASASRYDVVPP